MRAGGSIEIVQRLQQPPMFQLGEIDPTARRRLNFESNFTREQFEAAVRKGQEYIKAGDIFQFVPSQRLRVPSDGRSVRCVPRAADHQSVAVHVLSEEPRLHADRLEPGDSLPGGGSAKSPAGRWPARAAAARRPRKTRRWRAELLADPKERAEHIMLVDLHRNDVGRVAEGRHR